VRVEALLTFVADEKHDGFYFLSYLQQFLRVAHPNLRQIPVDGRSSLPAELTRHVSAAPADARGQVVDLERFDIPPLDDVANGLDPF
jgi:hypothetical protein